MGRSMIETDVAIVGAGGGGAVLALMLAQQGVRSLVLERGSGPPQGLRGEILQPNGQRVLDRLGLLDKLPPPSHPNGAAIQFLPGGRRTALHGRLWRPACSVQSRRGDAAKRRAPYDSRCIGEAEFRRALVRCHLYWIAVRRLASHRLAGGASRGAGGNLRTIGRRGRRGLLQGPGKSRDHHPAASPISNAPSATHRSVLTRPVGM